MKDSFLIHFVGQVCQPLAVGGVGDYGVGMIPLKFDRGLTLAQGITQIIDNQ